MVSLHTCTSDCASPSLHAANGLGSQIKYKGPFNLRRFGMRRFGMRRLLLLLVVKGLTLSSLLRGRRQRAGKERKEEGFSIIAGGSAHTERIEHSAWVLSACMFQPANGARTVSAGDDKTVRVYIARTTEQVAKAAAPTIAFSVMELTGKELPMTTLSALRTVGELKQEVARASGMTATQVRLVLKNEVLDDESRTLGEHGVEAESQVNAVSHNGVDVEE
jgi:ribosomal protein L37AE/L43A